MLCLGDLSGVEGVVAHVTEDLELLNLIELGFVLKRRLGNDLEDLGLGHGWFPLVDEYSITHQAVPWWVSRHFRYRTPPQAHWLGWWEVVASQPQ